MKRKEMKEMEKNSKKSKTSQGVLLPGFVVFYQAVYYDSGGQV